ncbi:MAG: AAA family ATPase [Bacteroidales bacterium]|nr:AAA family ATPase [Bacteroidales bacterium]
MRYVDKQLGQIFFERLFEILSNDKLSPKERIPKYRTLLDDLFKALTSDSNQLFSDLFSRSTYIFKEFNIPPDIKEATHSLRILANKVIHESDYKTSQKDDIRCVYQIANVIHNFSKVIIPNEISDYYKNHLNDLRKTVFKKKQRLPSYDFYAVIESIYMPQGNQEGKFCVLVCSTDELGIIKLKLWNNKDENGFGSNLADFGMIAEPFQTIYITKVEQSKNTSEDYFATKESLLILEPDYLIDAKELSECRQYSSEAVTRYEDNPLLYLLGRFTKGNITENIMVGNIAGRILDDIVTEQDGYEYKKTFETIMRENSFGMLCMANEKGYYDNTSIKKIYIEAQDHEKQIKDTIGPFFDKNLIMEPTFISNKYGLQGRLDLLIDYGKENNRKDIIELKSSRRYPQVNLGLYPNHEAQTLCYDLLVSSVYPDRVGVSSILYSNASSEERPLRNVTGERYLSKQDLLMLRNKIVANEMKMAKGDFKPFFDIVTDSFGSYPVYLKEQVDELRSVINSLEPLLKKYFLGFLKFIFYELKVAKIGSNNPWNSTKGYSEIWKASWLEKVEDSDVLVNMRVKEISDDFQVTLESDIDLFANREQLSSFRPGDTAILYPTYNQNELHPLKSQILKCRVLEVAFNNIKVSLINKQVSKDYLKMDTFWALDREFRESGYKQLLQLLYEFLKSDERIIDLILGRVKPRFVNLQEIPKNGMDPVQHENVKRAVAAEDYYLIQGPPGTGKTSKVLIEIVRNLVDYNQSVMIVAFTNRAVDEICEKLLQLRLDFVRLGRGKKQYYWSEISLKQGLKELSETVTNVKVFVSTISTFANSLDILKFKAFDTLIIDEASQVLEPQVVGVLKYFERWIFIGDENQLPAVVMQDDDDSQCNDKDLMKISLNNFRESLYYRLKKNAMKNSWNDCFGSLKFQYRMHTEIARFPKEFFYNNQLEELDDSQKASMPDYKKYEGESINEIISTSRMVFVPSKIDSRSKVNAEEANLAARLINHIAEIYADKFNPEVTVGVITPFRAQIATIRNHLDKKYRNVTIDTVERFQGSERDIIILSLAVKNPLQLRTIQSYNDNGVDRKLNVAITRAKEQLIILGSEDVLRYDPIFEALINFIKDNGGYKLNPLKSDLVLTNLF